MANLKILTQQLIQSKIPKVKRSGKIMDIGCGDGSFIISYMQPKELVGVDLNASEKNKFLHNLKINNTDGYFTNSLNNLSGHEKNSFDLITTIGVFELNNLRDVSAIFNTSREFLNENGIFFCIYYPWSYLSPIYLPLLFKGGRSKYEAETGLRVYSHKLKNIKKIAAESGLKVLETGCMNPYPSLFWRSNKLSKWWFNIRSKQDVFCYGGRYIVAKK